MNRETIQEKIKVILSSDQFCEIDKDITLDTKVTSVFNSIMFIKFIVAIEQELDIEFEDEDLAVENVDVFSDIVERIYEFISCK